MGARLCHLRDGVLHHLRRREAGRELDVQEPVADEGEVTAEYVDPYAIGFVAFYCTGEAAQEAADAYPSNGRGRGRGRD